MIEPSCELMGDLLVAYSDGELPEAQAERVAAHVAQCAGCRSELHWLGRSLDLARQVWEESAAGARVPVPRRAPLVRGRMAAALAAACLALSAAVGYWLFPLARPGGETAQNQAPPEVQKIEANENDVEAIIAREVRRARLAVAVELLASQPGLEEYRDQAEQYLRETYDVVPN